MTKTTNIPLAMAENFSRHTTAAMTKTPPASFNDSSMSGFSFSHSQFNDSETPPESEIRGKHGRPRAAFGVDVLPYQPALSGLEAAFGVEVLPSRLTELWPNDRGPATPQFGQVDHPNGFSSSSDSPAFMREVEDAQRHTRYFLTNTQRERDTTGQVAPPDTAPRITTTYWADQDTLVIQVEANDVTVSRRAWNNMINGTKLLNAAGLAPQLRDEILKNERDTHIIETGPEVLNGVWIPYKPALDFANKYGITESLYPLFVHYTGPILFPPIPGDKRFSMMSQGVKEMVSAQCRDRRNRKDP